MEKDEIIRKVNEVYECLQLSVELLREAAEETHDKKDKEDYRSRVRARESDMQLMEKMLGDILISRE